MHKKAQGISMETIVVAVIVLFVLAVLLLVFTGRINIFGIGLKDCSTIQGECLAKPCKDLNKASLYGGKCTLPGTNTPDPTNKYCCSIVESESA